MVSKSAVHRQPSLIFITVGSTEYPFARLQEVTSLFKETKFRLLPQSYDNTLTEAELIRSISQADKVILHAAPGSLYLVTKYAKNMPLIIPRRASFGEAVGDHQLHFARYIKKCLPNQYNKYVVTDSDIGPFVHDYVSQAGKKNILKNYLFPSDSRLLFEKSFKRLLLQKGLLE